jgi:hypothetical protein
MSQDDLSFNDALNEYFKLKDKFEHYISSSKKKIIYNVLLSNREKRSEYLKLMPKCVHCKRPSKKGTIFSTEYHPSDDKSESYRKFKAFCGDLANPCNLNIEIVAGKTENIEDLINTANKDIKNIKNEIIDDKNKLLFGLITTETAIENFDSNKSYLNDLNSLLFESYLDKLNNITNNPQKKIELDEALVQSYIFIDEIKNCIKKMNENDDRQYAVDAAEIYVNSLNPLLSKIRNLKYKQNIVFNDEDKNVCRLIQNAVPLVSLDISNHNKVLKFDVGLASKKYNKKPLIIETDESENEEKDKGSDKFSIKIKETAGKLIEKDDPIIGQGTDGIDWHLPEYKNLWSKLPPKLKTEFKLNIDWMKDFMYKCLNAKIIEGTKFNGCKLPTPPNLIIPPREMQNGNYDFGVSIYNTAFNKQPESLQKTYLTFYKEDPTTKEKNYEMLEDAMNSLVEKEVDFGRGFF